MQQEEAGAQDGSWERWRARLRACNRAERPSARRPREVWAGWVERWRQPRAWLLGGGFLLLVLGYLWQASVFWPQTIDDAYISFRYALNLVEGHGLRYNPGDAPVEGFTNLTWVLAIAAALALGIDAMFAAKVLGLACGIGILATSWAFVRRLRGGRDDVWNLLAPAFLAFNSSAARWALMGLETQLAVLLVFYTYYRFVKEVDDPRAWVLSPLTATLAAMTRIDSLFYMAPLALYGAGLVIAGWAPLRRLLVWSAIAGVSFGLYYGWKVAYFGDLLPNTYYAKHRLLGDAMRVRARTQIETFYLAHGVVEPERGPRERAAAPQPPPRTPLETVRFWITGGPSHMYWWTAWWVGGALLLLLLPRGRLWVLVLLPCLLNAYYVYYNNGDWMPMFRFFQIVIPFLALLAPLAIGRVRQVTEGRGRWLRVPTQAFFVAACVGLAFGQLGIGSVQIFNDTPKWFARPPDWGTLDKVRSNYRAGFVVPLRRVAEWLLLNTQDDTTIFMGDIGWPMWLAGHLTCLPVEGLTDKHLGDAPSVRGELRSLDEHIAIARREFDPGSRPLEPDEIERRIVRTGARAYQKEHTARDLEYVLGRRDPEYLLVFAAYEKPNAQGKMRVYPDLSRAIHESEDFAERYEFAWHTLKVHRVYATVYRRRDVPERVPDPVLSRRLRRALELNPRVPRLAVVSYRQMREMQPGPAREQVRRLVLEWVPRLVGDPRAFTALWSEAVRSGNPQMAEAILTEAMEHAPEEPAVVMRVAEARWRKGEQGAAIQALERVASRGSGSDNSIELQLMRYYRGTERWEDALRAGRAAIARNDEDVRAWMQFAELCDQASRRASGDRERSIALGRQAIEAYQRLIELGDGQSGQRWSAKIAALNRRIDRLEGAVAPR